MYGGMFGCEVDCGFGDVGYGFECFFDVVYVGGVGYVFDC